MKRFISLLCMCVMLGLLVLLTGCPNTTIEGEKNKSKGKVYFSFFDTVSYVYSYSGDELSVFDENCNEVSKLLEKYHRLFDIYNEYSGVTNLRTLNLNAGKEAMKVDKELIDFLLYAKELYVLTNGEMNVMMGSVLRLWHDCREMSKNPSLAKIPTTEELNEASLHTDISNLVIDEQNQTVRILDAKASIDVGALGKGYATEKAAELLRSRNALSYVLNIGGNIRTIGTKPDGSGWGTAIKDPQDSNKYAIVIDIADTSCVTSGDYERFFTVGGTKYHHIIDKDTLMPSTYFSSVSIITPNSGLADALSTALFTMSYEDGVELVNKIGNVEVFWITRDGTKLYTEGFGDLIKK